MCSAATVKGGRHLLAAVNWMQDTMDVCVNAVSEQRTSKQQENAVVQHTQAHCLYTANACQTPVYCQAHLEVLQHILIRLASPVSHDAVAHKNCSTLHRTAELP